MATSVKVAGRWWAGIPWRLVRWRKWEEWEEGREESSSSAVGRSGEAAAEDRSTTSSTANKGTVRASDAMEGSKRKGIRKQTRDGDAARQQLRCSENEANRECDA